MKKKIKDLTLKQIKGIKQICINHTSGLFCDKDCPFWKDNGICIMCYKPFDKNGFDEPNKEVEVPNETI